MYTKCTRIEWEVFESIMDNIDEGINKEEGYIQRKLASFQVIIACGCLIGPVPKELVNMRWKDLLYKTRYELNNEPHRNAVVIPDKFQNMIIRNFSLVKPFSAHDLIAQDCTGRIGVAMSFRKFNTILAKIFLEYAGINEGVTAHTFRKAHFRRLWDLEEESDKAIQFLIKELMLDEVSALAYVKL